MNEEIKKIRDYIKCPQFGDNHYGKWGALNLEQRIKIKKMLDYITSLQEENQKLNKIIEDIDKYIHIFKIEDIGEKTMLILNDILLIKNGLGKDVVRLNKLTELKNEVE